MTAQNIVSRDEWLAARLDLLAKEKELTRLRDQLNAQRRQLPRTRVTKTYTFEGRNGPETLAELFDGRSQLIVQHFMYGPDWEAGCPSCSFWADSYNGFIDHLAHRDITMVTVSKADLATLDAYKQRMGWTFKWLSSQGNDFNEDYHVSFTQAEVERGDMYYNYRRNKFPSEEAPGVSVFCLDDQGEVFHTYSCYSRGLDILNGAYHYMDLVPKGRDEDQLPWPMAWLRRRDEYA